MRNIKIIVCFLLSIQFGFAQDNKINIYYDAIDLTNGKKVDSILAKYRVESNNNFLKEYFIQPSIGILWNTNPEKIVLGGNLMNKIGNIEITPIADGLAQFIASRVKKELSIAFFTKFKEEITDKNYKDLQILFPETFELLQLIDTDIYDFQPYLSGLQRNAQTDFKMMPNELPKLLTDPTTRLSILIKEKPKSKYILGLSFSLISSLHQKKNIGAALENLNTSQYLSNEQKIPELRKTIDLVRLFSLALRDSTVTDLTYYLKSDKIASITKNDTLLKNIIGLAIAASRFKNDKIGEFDGGIYETLNNPDYVKNITAFQNIIAGFKDANKIFEDARKEKAETRIGTYLQGVNQIFKTGKMIANTVKIDTSASNNIFKYLDNSMDLVGALYQKKYSMAILQALDFYRTLAGSSSSPINTKIYKYGTFLAQISELDKAEDVVKVLEHYAAPVGSYRDKSISKFTVSLDSFTGIGLGSFNGDSIRFALSTPIGVSFSFSRGLGKWSWTVMPTLFDIGPLVSYRFLNSTGEVPNIHLKEIFAPGIFASVGFNSKCPIFLNLGYQKPAYLKTINATNATYNLQQYNFFTANIAVNIPLFRLFTN